MPKDEPGLAIWLGLADSACTRRKIVRFGDPGTLRSGRVFSVGLVLALGLLWVAASEFGWGEPFYWPSVGETWRRLVQLASEGFRGVPLWEEVAITVVRALAGVTIGAAAGIPLGFAMALSSAIRGLFAPIMAIARPFPAIALIPLLILWFGVDEMATIFLLFVAALLIMARAAQVGASGVAIAKVHAAYSLGATPIQVLRRVILPSALPEIFTGFRTALGVCWGTVVAAELVAADKGLGAMIMTAKNLLQTDTVVIGVAIIGIIGLAIDLLMRWAERLLVPWKRRRGTD